MRDAVLIVSKLEPKMVVADSRAVGRARRALGILAVFAVSILGLAQSARGTAGSSSIQLGAVTVLSARGADTEDPQLAMNTSGAYLLTWADHELFGPFSRLSGTTASDGILGEPEAYGRLEDVEPLEPAVSNDGQEAIIYGVRRAIGKNVLFGLDLAETAPGNPSWVTRELQVPPTNVDLDAIGGAVFAQDGRLAATWATETETHESFVLAQQPRFGAAVQTRRLFTDQHGAGVVPLAPGFDAAGRLVIAFWTGGAGGIIVPTTSCCRSSDATVPEQAMAITTTASGRLGSPQFLRAGCEEEQLVVAASGAAAISMTCGKGRDGAQVYISERSPGRPFVRPVLVSGHGDDEFAPELTLTSSGRLWVAWEHRKSLNPHTGREQVRTEVASAKLGAAFGRPEWTTPYMNAEGQPTLLADPTGEMFLTVQNARGQIIIRSLLPDGALGTPTALSPPMASNPEVQVDSSGRGVAVWNVYDGRVTQAEGRRFDLPGLP